ncbi:MAG TPA: transporter substrate-binding domain-containing protein [Paraburkholderia sp.]|uniref:transporter substrate-binding domain-containing protein n=1 Tax=Paraburkholderia sp. TaxID=1926495 RepID=UPI002CC8FBE8|nr:transporter substrate-binding domain-containing protein [Paraburkholderia sp.]HTR08613.1 transporter substrate-binding domain-containing protein [Paraburkholderia sp.]
MKPFLRVALSAVTALGLLGAAAIAHASDTNVVRFGIDPTYPPMDSKAPDGSVRGFDVDLGNEICRRMHAQCKWVELEFSGMIPALQARKIDAVLSAMAITEKRMQQIAFSSKLYQFKSHLVAHKGAGFGSDAASLAGKHIGVQSGTQFETYALAQWAPHGVSVVSYKNQEEVFEDLVTGRLDAALLGTVEADQGFLQTPQGKDFAFIGQPLSMGDHGVGIGMRKDDAQLKASIDSAIASMRADGTYERIAHRYFSFDPYGE